MLGLIPDRQRDVDADARLRHVGILLGAQRIAGPIHIDRRDLLDGVQDQGGSNSCVGQALASSIYLTAASSGQTIERPSAKGIYDLARLVDSPNVLDDVGSRPRAAIIGMQDYGMVANSRWPLTALNVNDKPPLDVFQHAYPARLSAYYRIVGASSALLVRTALARGFFPVFGMPVDEAYQAHDGRTTFTGLRGPMVGYHMQCVIGCGTDDLLVLNSWGRGWGDGGFIRIADAAFDTLAFDVLVPTVAPAAVS